MSSALDHIHAAVLAARQRWAGRQLTVAVGQREYEAMQQELTYLGFLGRSPAECPSITMFMGYPLERRAAPYGVWVEPQ